MALNHRSEKRASKYRFNAIDVFIIVIVILCVLGVYFRSTISSWIGIDKGLKEYEISFVINHVKSTSDQYLSTGNEVRMSSGVELGTIGKCSSLPAKTYVSDTNGDMIEVSYPKDTYIDITGYIICKGIEKDDGFYLSGTYLLSPGTVISASTEMMDFSFTVTGISEAVK